MNFEISLLQRMAGKRAASAAFRPRVLCRLWAVSLPHRADVMNSAYGEDTTPIGSHAQLRIDAICILAAARMTCCVDEKAFS